MDFMKNHPHGINLEAHICRRILQAISRDSSLLMKASSMNYSLLIGYRYLRVNEEFSKRVRMLVLATPYQHIFDSLIFRFNYRAP